MSIGEEAFEWCKNLTSLTIPATVTRIALGALRDCKRLKAFSVADDNSKFKTVSGLLLTKDGKTLVRGVNGDVTIPDGVTYIGENAFVGSGLTSVTIPDNVASIGDGAFACSGLTTVTIGKGVTSIGERALDSLPGLKRIYVSVGYVDRIKGLLLESGHKIDGIEFVEREVDGQ